MTTQTRTKRTAKVQKTSGVIAIDNGGFNTKIYADGMDKPVSFSSHKAYGYDNEMLRLDDHSQKISWNGEIYFTGILMMDTGNFLSGYSDTKTTEYFIVNTLLAIAIYGFDINSVITTVPYSRYNNEERQAIRDILEDEHTIYINNKEYNFQITDVEVVAEAMIASHALETEGLVRWLDLGSRTVGFASTFTDDQGFLNPLPNQSGTIEGEGLDIRNIAKTKQEFKKYVTNFTRPLIQNKWNYEDTIIAFGGGANYKELGEVLKERFPNIIIADEPLYLQVIGMYNFAINYIWVEEDLNAEDDK